MKHNVPEKWGKRRRRPVPDMRPDFEGIMAKVRANVILTENACWEWQMHCNALGYGTISWKTRIWMLTRLVYAANHGAFDKDLDICHTCDNPGCCNPQHLWAGEHKANLLDASKKKRLNGQWKTECKRGHPLSGDNLYVQPKWGYRKCKACDKVRHLENKMRKMSAGEQSV